MFPWQLRPFVAADYEAAYLLWTATPGVGLDATDSRQGTTRFLAHNPGLSFVADDEQGHLIATILCGHDGRRGFIYHLAVAAPNQRQGLGKALVQRCLQALAEQGITKCHVMIFRQNDDAGLFWQRIGGRERTDLILSTLPTARAL